jgi:hypothetical protein
VNPIKASFKFDNSGFGSDAQKSEAGNHWWERVFNEASSNIKVEGGQKISTLQEDGVELTNKTYSLKKIKENHGEMTYGSFLKSSTLLANEEAPIPGHITTDDIEIPKFAEISDEALFSACEGRTAHKGARHGLGLTGKLSRLEEQDRILLEKLKQKGSKVGIFSESKSENDDDGFILVKSKKKKKKQDRMEVESENAGSEPSEPSDYRIRKSKKKEKRDKQMERELMADLDVKAQVSDSELLKLENLVELPKKSKKNKRNSDGTLVYRDPAVLDDPPKKKKKRKDRDDDEDDPDVLERRIKKKAKKESRRKRQLEDDLEIEHKSKKKRIESSESSSPDVLQKLNPPLGKKWKKEKRVKGSRDDPMGDNDEKPKKKKIDWKSGGYIRDLADKMEIAASLDDPQNSDASK